MADKTIRSISSEELRHAAKLVDLKHGMELNNISRIELNTRVIANILNCIKSDNYLDISDGLYFLMGFLQKYKLNNFGDDFTDNLIKKIPELITVSQNSQVRSYALQFFVWLKDNYPNYREIMLDFLCSSDLSQKRCALTNYETYCMPKEVEPLLRFQNDSYVAELSMCGPLEYQFRNFALEKISKVIGKNFMLNKIKERHPDWGGDYVNWYDWEPFLDWHSNKNKKSIFDKKK